MIARGYEHDWGVLLDSGAAFKAVSQNRDGWLGWDPEIPTSGPLRKARPSYSPPGLLIEVRALSSARSRSSERHS